MIRAGVGVALAAALNSVACTRKDPPPPGDAGAAQTRSNASTPSEPPPELLYLPDGGDLGPERAPGQEILPGPWGQRSGRCPPEMVDVESRFCIDRFEVSLVDVEQGRELSPYYHPTRAQTQRAYGEWQRNRQVADQPQARDMVVPAPPSFALREEFEPKAVVKQGAVPNGYLSADIAERACKNAGKRLCAPSEWVTACRGEKNRKYPYGDSYEQGRCNVFRESHPALLLHGNASIHHLDPRLNKVRSGGKPLLRATGATPDCKSQWGADAIYDMVGNLDEWVDDSKGLFLGGFFSRNTREGCDSSIRAHPRSYFDYSIGVRCCK